MNYSRRILREILTRPKLTICPSLYDPLSVRIAMAEGFEVGLIGGSVASLMVLGAPDIALITLTELVQIAARACAAGSIPLVVDADHGYGNALNVARTVRELEAAGVAALTIDDTTLPRPYGSRELTLVPQEESVGKLLAALDARSDSSLSIIARTDISASASEAECLERLRAYEYAGVDAICIVGVLDRAQLDRLMASLSLPVLLVGKVAGATDDHELLARLGIRIWFEGHAPYLSALRAMRSALVTQKKTGQQPGAETLMTRSELVALTRAEVYEAASWEFLG